MDRLDGLRRVSFAHSLGDPLLRLHLVLALRAYLPNRCDWPAVCDSLYRLYV